MIATDERHRLTRLIELTPPGARRAEYEARLTQIAAKPSGNGNGDLAALHAEQNRLRTRWENGLNFLEGLRERTGQDTPEFERLFAEWQKIDAALRRVLDKIEGAEMTARIREQGAKIEW
jgi:hypothetical protein